MIKKSLVGKFFHSFCTDGHTSLQGQVLSKHLDNYYLVQLYDWIIGQESEQILVPFKNMITWHFYDTSEQMTSTYDSILSFRDNTIAANNRGGIVEESI